MYPMDYSSEPSHSELLTIQGDQPFNAEAPVASLVEFNLTPEELVYCRNHGPVREFDDETYSIVIKGGVEKEQQWTVPKLKETFLTVQVVAALQCAGNRRNEMGAIKSVSGVGWDSGVIANCKWGGVRLRDVLGHAGVQQGNSHVCFASYATLCQDDDYYGSSITLERAMDLNCDALLAFELALYYGQNSYGATHSSTDGSQRTLSDYCQDDTINVIPLAFLTVFFSEGGLPEIDLASTCNNLNGNVFPGTKLAKCLDLADDIRACQARGKIVTISLGGATGVAGFSSEEQAQQFAETVWNLFLGGDSDTRPFGDAVLDGVDLDVESGGGDGMIAFARHLRQLSKGGRKYYLTAAPQCPFPDAYLGNVISAVGFDAVYIQCKYIIALGRAFSILPALTILLKFNNYDNPSAWNYGVWDHWAKTTSPNKKVKVYIGAPAAESAAGVGYVPAETLGAIARETRAKYSSFGGIMLWDASQAYGKPFTPMRWRRIYMSSLR
ncbi:hypothetical protein H0H87_007751 [Tephrocybe sp. NHM501043]|nr:hypothetical protein H0H87_007751 [Tephrocybe sp. NHM501043]